MSHSQSTTVDGNLGNGALRELEEGRLKGLGFWRIVESRPENVIELLRAAGRAGFSVVPRTRTFSPNMQSPRLVARISWDIKIISELSKGWSATQLSAVRNRIVEDPGSDSDVIEALDYALSRAREGEKPSIVGDSSC